MVAFLISTVIVLTCFVIVIKAKYNRSFMAIVVEMYLRLVYKEYDEGFLKDYKNKEYNIPKLLEDPEFIKEYEYKKMRIFNFGNSENKTDIILYLHGGSYIRNPRFHHIKFLKKLARKSNINVIAPLYFKAPNYGPLINYEILTEIYLELLNKYNNVYLFGDSSGGGLALGLCEYFLEKKIQQPKHLVLFSPWVDIELNNKLIYKYQKNEPLVSIKNAREAGKVWRGDLDPHDYRVSPLYGNMIGLTDVSLFVGTREVLYPDNIMLYELLKDSNVNVELYIGEGLNHVYPIYPIPEACKTFKDILKIFKQNGE